MGKLSKEYTEQQKIRSTRRWALLSAYMRRKYPICFDPFGDCGTSLAEDVHHIVPLRRDKTLAYTKDNLVTLCRSCHARVEAIEDKYGDSTFLFSNTQQVGVCKSLENKEGKTELSIMYKTHPFLGGRYQNKVWCNRLKHIREHYCGNCKVVKDKLKDV